MDKNEIYTINRRISLAKLLNVYIKNVCGAGMSGCTGHQAKINEERKLRHILMKDLSFKDK